MSIILDYIFAGLMFISTAAICVEIVRTIVEKLKKDKKSST